MRCRLISLMLVLISLLCACHNDDKSYTLRNPKEQSLKISIDKEFSSQEQIHIQKAFNTWEQASSDKIKFDITWNEPEPGSYYRLISPPMDGGIFFWSLKATDENFPIETQELYKNYSGLTIWGRGNKSVNLIVFKETNKDRFYQVALHEIGHLLGLSHIKSSLAVMSPSAFGDCITPEDAIQLCDIYNCSPRPECSGLSLFKETEAITTPSSSIFVPSLKSFSSF